MGTVAVLVLVTGCGSTRAADPVAVEPTGEPTTVEPTWPPAGCREMSHGIFDYFEDVSGRPGTPEEAALAQVDEGVSVVRAPEPEPHHERVWWVLDDSGEAVAALGIHQQEDGGWLVTSEERCVTRTDD